ncbi:MAG: bifunctional DNA-formamidopyrimidine glycosylase/DNA-(apurinic or apyrimidinic site) lyase [Desulfuromonadales bacterium]|nr:bifunctional DNA-formamidopyrimidine glycosylase/DNA-(apurinic or apyrimidinic site) lyase [Desulfuromonadales bacterium]
MPELPEVETSRRGIAPVVEGQTITSVVCRVARLRLPLPADLSSRLSGRKILKLDRRAKYLLFRLDIGTLLIHLGMSGHLRIVSAGTPCDRHDHVDIHLGNDTVIRFHDPRKFGLVALIGDAAEEHPLLCHLGPEPLIREFNGQSLFQRSRGRKIAVKSFIMDQQIVVGVGNIYASEALFRAGIHPLRAAGRIAATRYQLLAESIKDVLSEAIDAGGTTLRDFFDSSARPGYFRNNLLVYGCGGQPCRTCGCALKSIRIAQRATVYCAYCQH